MNATKNFEDLVEIIRILRRECPWDRKQTHESIKDNLIEEAYEAVEAIDNNDPDELKKELGDLLLHVVFHSRMADEKNNFAIDDVILAIQEKLIRRHPHVFGDSEATSEKQVAENWETIKMKEGKKSVLDGIPTHLPALIRAQRMQEKAANVGFDWPEITQVIEKLEEELEELKEALQEDDPNRKEEEFGDFIFSLVNVGRFLELNAEDCLRLTNRKFEQRFRHIEERVNESDRKIGDFTLNELDDFWTEAKRSE
ncbi:MAG: nucleoside triphosphate pyrophosphohydrolase [Balneolaceae bacterium]|nr:nucleoside triphosphate pyrophosphohydrolase [Balneolaceae bacterium]